MIATRYEEIVTKQLFAGNVQLRGALQPLLEAALQILNLSEAQSQRVVVREDAGGGSLEKVNWVLGKVGHFHGKDCSAQRAERLAESVKEWFDDPHPTRRQFGWVTEPADDYVRPVRRIAVRCKRKNGQWSFGVLISTFDPQTCWP